MKDGPSRVTTGISSDATSSKDLSSSPDSLLRAVAHVPAVPVPEDEPSRVGQQLAGYAILRELGHGGMGVVYAAEDTKLRRLLALKVLRARYASDAERRQRFLREARAASAITHPNVATVFGVQETPDGSVCIAMELIEGRTLRSRLKEGRIPVDEAVRISRQMLLGLHKAHEVGIVHRDLKPDNVMLTGGDGLKILDFGLAKPIGKPIRESTHSSELATVEGRVLGTLGYMSPEQAKGLPVDVRTDIFSFGIVLYEMLAGERPFRASGNVALLIAIDRDPAPRLPKGIKVPRRLEKLLERCLEKRPSDRFATCDQILEELDQPAAWPGDSRIVRRAAAACGIAFAFGGFWVVTRGEPPRDPTSVPEARAMAGIRPAPTPRAPALSSRELAFTPVATASTAPRTPAPRRRPPIKAPEIRDPLAEQK